jgi:hypothetical protein
MQQQFDVTHTIRQIQIPILQVQQYQQMHGYTIMYITPS